MAFYMSVAFFCIVSMASVAFFGLSFLSQSKISEYQNDIAQLDTHIANAKSNRLIMIANIIENNLIRPSIDLEKLVADFRMAARQSGVRLQGFSIANDILSTEVSSSQSIEGSKHTDAVTTIIQMMRSYNAHQATSESTSSFRLEPILEVQGTPAARTSKIQFIIVPTSSQ